MTTKKNTAEGNYVCTSVSISEEELKTFPALTVKENTELIEKLSDLTKSDKVAFVKRPLRTSNLPVKFYDTHAGMFESIKKKLKKDNISFSRAYKIAYKRFFKSKINK